MALSDCQTFLDAVQEALQQVTEVAELRSEDMDGVLIRLDVIFQCLASVEPVFLPSVNFSNLLSAVSDMIFHVQSAICDSDLSQRPGPGRPALNISEHVLSSLLEQDFTQVEVAKIFGCSTKTVRRRIVEFGLSDSIQYTKIPDDVLDGLVQDFVLNFPTSGQKTLAGYLRTLGYRIQRCRIRESLYRVDPWGVEQRSKRLLHRRRYKVPGPNSLWHIDGTTSSCDGASSYMVASMATPAFQCTLQRHPTIGPVLFSGAF